jgi:TetR/AcrR family transcriptional repressor of nem operon
MVRVSRNQAATNRETLVAAAGRLFRQRGVDGVGVAELCEAAGMTHGGLYSRFGSKDELAVEAFAQGQAASKARMEVAIGEKPDLAAVLDFYVSRRQRDNAAECCPMVASASEAARQSKPFRSGFAEAFRELNGTVRDAFGGASGNKADESAMVIGASMIGIVVVARALRGPDPALSDALIDASQAILGTFAKTPARGRRARKRRAKRP